MPTEIGMRRACAGAAARLRIVVGSSPHLHWIVVESSLSRHRIVAGSSFHRTLSRPRLDSLVRPPDPQGEGVVYMLRYVAICCDLLRFVAICRARRLRECRLGAARPQVDAPCVPGRIFTMFKSRRPLGATHTRSIYVLSPPAARGNAKKAGMGTPGRRGFGIVRQLPWRPVPLEFEARRGRGI